MNRADMHTHTGMHLYIRIWANQGIPAMPVWAANMRNAYGLRKIAHTRMGKMPVWNRAPVA